MAKLTFLEVVSVALFMSVVLWQATSLTVTTVPSCDGVTCPSDRLCKMNNFGQPECVCRATCTLEYAPICGSDRVTYANKCTFNVAVCRTFNSITMAHRGKCKTGPKVPSCDGVTCPSNRLCKKNNFGRPECVCNEICTKEYNPVCGSDGVTYANKCTFNVAVCKTFNSIKMVHRGECKTGK